MFCIMKGIFMTYIWDFDHIFLFLFFSSNQSVLSNLVFFSLLLPLINFPSSFLILLHMSLPLRPCFFFPFLLILLLLFPAPPFFFTCVFFLFHSSPPHLSPLSLLLVKVLISGWSLQTDWLWLNCVSMLYLLNHTGNIQCSVMSTLVHIIVLSSASCLYVVQLV